MSVHGWLDKMNMSVYGWLAKVLPSRLPQIPEDSPDQRRDVARGIVQRYARGNVRLAQGRFISKQDRDRAYAEIAGFTFK